MIQEQLPIRKDMLISHSYQFLDPSGQPISLVNHVTVSLEVKLQGQVVQTLTASFDQQTNGTVKCNYTYTTIGIWTAQFYCEDGSGNRLWGEPVLFRVVPNVGDLALTELPNY